MVDIIKFLPPVLPSFRSNIHQIRNRTPSEQFPLPNVNNHLSQNDRSNFLNNNTKRWIGRCPGDPSRQVNISDQQPYSLHRKVIYSELSRCCPTTTVDASIPNKIKQQKNCYREPLKVTTVTPNSVLSNSRLFDALSKHVTIKPEPLRPTNNFVSSTLSSWQKYWTSTHTQRKRKEINDSESIFYRPKREQSILTTTHFVTIRDSSFHIDTENNSNNSTSSSCTQTKPLSSAISDKRSSSIIKEEDQIFLTQFISPYNKTPPMNQLKLNEDKSLSTVLSESLIINDDDNEINTITTKIYKLPLPSYKPKLNKLISNQRLRSKSLEKKPIISSKLFEIKESGTTTPPSSNTSHSKRRQETPTNKSHRSRATITKQQQQQQQSLSTVMTTTARSKYEQIKWDEPYVGVRFDPPTPPSSPTLFIWPKDNDHDENDTPIEQIPTNEVHL